MKQVCFSSSLVFILLVILVNFHGGHVHGAGLINTACKTAVTEFQEKVTYSFCVASLEANPKSKNYGIEDLAVVAYEHATKKGISVNSYIHQLLKDGKQSSDVMVRLKGCSRDYKDIGSLMKDATRSFRGGDTEGGATGLDTAENIVLSCQGRFDGGFTSPLAKEDNEFLQHIYISLTITLMIQALWPPS
ncbi:uncharacterized protein LOC113325134 [Papaver somniferum]|uniref:uncharacterized protein LOC113325134 n=1 Tax=Papaver somniferum TaxID=3469 RepID=UPI000E6F75C3|nr:uncharacterized protein LOC113325134 [Papaver somniferum]